VSVPAPGWFTGTSHLLHAKSDEPVFMAAPGQIPMTVDRMTASIGSVAASFAFASW
jgi:hypothetical protein